MQCPDDRTLRQAIGKDAGTTDDLSQELQDHVETCEDCQQRLSELCEWDLRPMPRSMQDESGVASQSADNVERSSRTGQRAFANASLPKLERYRILRELGRGGMGVVYEARDEELGRTVAIKMLLTGALAGPERLARFHREALAMAKLTHPNIVQIYDTGEHDGLPYIALEYIETGSLVQHLDGTPWNPQNASEFLRYAAEAIETAHQAGLIHRDLKPANVLVSEDSHLRSGLSPKITDFGLVKAESDENLTKSGVALGTPRYLSPEQALGREESIRAQADIYALGTILYELLTGRPPFQSEMAAEVLRQICHDEPIDAGLLNPAVPRDLATVCHKCLRKDPGSRYASAQDLADDLARFENRQPIHARPVSKVERIAKWGRRNPVVSSLFFALLLLVVVGVIGWIDFTSRLSAKTQIATQKAEEAKDRERDALDAADATEEVLLFFTEDLIQSVAPAESGRNVKVFDVLLAAENQIDQKFKGRPRIEAAVRLGISKSLYALGEYQLALEQIKIAFSIHRAEYGLGGRQSIESGILLVELLSTLSNTDEAFALLAEITKAVESPDAQLSISLEKARADILYTAGQFKEAFELFQSLYKKACDELGVEHENTLNLLNAVAHATHESGDQKGAQKLLEQYREIMIRLHGKEDIEVVNATRNLAVSYSMTGRVKEALTMQKDSYAICGELYGPDHPQTLTSLHNYAMALSRNKQYDAALPLLQRAVEQSVAKWGANHEISINYIGNLAYMHFEFGFTDRAAEFLEKYCDPILSEAFDHPNWAILLLNYGRVRQRLGELDEAKRLFDQCQGICDRSSGTTPLLAETLRKSKDSLEKRLVARDKKKKSLEPRDD